MKKTILYVMVFLFFSAIGFLSCLDFGGDDEETDNSSLLTTLMLASGSSDSNFFYDSVRNTLPKFEASTTKTPARALTSGTITYQLFELLRNYEFPTHEGIIDMHNIYKDIHTAGLIYSVAESSCTTITEAAVASPYDLGLTDTYNCAGNRNTMADNYANGFAIKDDGSTKYGLLTYRWAPDPSSQEGHGILQGSYNETTGDLAIRMLHLTYYPAEDGFVIRSHIAGNDQTHAFTVQMISSGTGSSPSWISVVGKGVSQGDGNYFLFKVNNSSGVTGNYFCIPATATESSLEDIHTSTPTGSATVDTNCADYQTDVDAMTFLTTSDVPTVITSFSDSSILLSY